MICLNLFWSSYDQLTDEQKSIQLGYYQDI